MENKGNNYDTGAKMNTPTGGWTVPMWYIQKCSVIVK